VYSVLAIYYTLLYIVFAKGFRDLGKGTTLIVFSEEPLVKHLTKLFGIDRLKEIQKDVFKFLEENVDRLKDYRDREALLEKFERGYELQVLAEILDIIRSRLGCSTLDKAAEVLEFYGELHEALQLLERVRYGYGIVRTAGVCNALVKPQSPDDMRLLDTLSRIGLAIHLPRDYSYLAEDLGNENHFVIPCIVLQGSTLAKIRDLVDNTIKQNHKVVQKAIEELGKALGYETRSEMPLEIPSFRLDVAWMRNGRLVKAFEIQFMLSKEKILNALYNLKKAYREGAEIYLVVPHRHAIDHVKAIVREEPEIEKALNILTVNQVIKLYEAVKENRAIVSLLR